MNYPGGKGSLYQKIINLIPPHRSYIETHAGGGAVLRHKRPARSNIAIDVDTEALNMLASTIAKNGGTEAQFINTDAVTWLRTYDFRGDEFVYADPPYVMSSRRQHRQLYRYEYTEQQHIDLLDCLIAVPCKVMISGYWSELYADKLTEWHVISFEARTRGGSWATECLWMNYPEPVELHDYRYLGDDYRERERIKRKKARWAKKFQAMPLLERQAIMAALEAVKDERRKEVKREKKRLKEGAVQEGLF